MSVYDYRVFGLKVRSALELPELFADHSDAAPDVTISCGPVIGTELGAGLHALNGGLVLVISEVAGFRIADGTSITIDRAEGVPERNVRLFLLGSAFGALLHQRGLLPLHANAVEIGGKAVAFMGESGVGKSTLAAWFHDRRCRILADDICVVARGEDMPVAFRGVARLRLWRDALEASGRRPGDHVRSAVLDDIRDKFDLPFDTDRAAPPELPLAGLYLLARAEKFSIERMRGVEAAEALFANTYRGGFIERAGSAAGHFRICSALASATPVYRVNRVWGFDGMGRQNESIMKHALEVAAGSTPASAG